MKRISAANPSVAGPTNVTDGAAWFVNGVAYVDDDHPFLTYVARRDGYTVEQVDQAPADYLAAVEESRNSGEILLGTRLRDAKVDPRPEDAPAGALTREAQAAARAAREAVQ